MITIQSSFESAVELFQDEKVKERIRAIYSEMQTYIINSGYEKKVAVNVTVLGYAITDYMADIRRLKEFHPVPHVNSIKLVSYTIYWLLRRKPIQIQVDDKELLYVNERFALAYLAEFLSSEEKGFVINRNEKALSAFLESSLYYFKYRLFSAQDIEMMILSFFAGQVYQSDKEDISGKLPASDHEVVENWEAQSNKT
jgi:hypothetical protein